jgi:16S rRNA processing protein RimM
LLERFVAGITGQPFGLKGFVKVRSLSGEIEHLLTLKTVCLRQEGKERVVTVEETGLALPAVLMKFAGIESPEAAKALSGAELLVEREQAAPLREGEFYIEDLKGLEVIDGSGERLGSVRDVLEGGGGFLVELEMPSGECRLIPFRNEFFGEIDLQKGRALLHARWILE